MAHWDDALPYFPKAELACRGSGVVRLDLRFAAALPALRAEWGRSLVPTSVCRAPAHNAKVGGHPRSLHLTENAGHPAAAGTMAADLSWRNWTRDAQLQLARLAWGMGWAVGLHDAFIHIDRRADIGVAKAVFLYGQWSGPFQREDIVR
jgi:hypothetical protein